MILVIDNYDSFTYNLVQYSVSSGRTSRSSATTSSRSTRSSRPRRIESSFRQDRAGLNRPATMDVIRRLGESTPILGVCLGHQAIGAVVWRRSRARRRADARQDVDDRARRPRRLQRHPRAVRRLALPLARRRGKRAAGGARDHRADARRLEHHGGSATGRGRSTAFSFIPNRF